MYHYSRARGTVLSLQTSMCVGQKHERKYSHRAVLYKYRNLETGNFLLAMSISRGLVAELSLLVWK